MADSPDVARASGHTVRVPQVGVLLWDNLADSTSRWTPLPSASGWGYHPPQWTWLYGLTTKSLPMPGAPTQRPAHFNARVFPVFCSLFCSVHGWKLDFWSNSTGWVSCQPQRLAEEWKKLPPSDRPNQLLLQKEKARLRKNSTNSFRYRCLVTTSLLSPSLP